MVSLDAAKITYISIYLFIDRNIYLPRPPVHFNFLHSFRNLYFATHSIYSNYPYNKVLTPTCKIQRIFISALCSNVLVIAWDRMFTYSTVQVYVTIRWLLILLNYNCFQYTSKPLHYSHTDLQFIHHDIHSYKGIAIFLAFLLLCIL